MTAAFLGERNVIPWKRPNGLLCHLARRSWERLATDCTCICLLGEYEMRGVKLVFFSKLYSLQRLVHVSSRPAPLTDAVLGIQGDADRLKWGRAAIPTLRCYHIQVHCFLYVGTQLTMPVVLFISTSVTNMQEVGLYGEEGFGCSGSRHYSPELLRFNWLKPLKNLLNARLAQLGVGSTPSLTRRKYCGDRCACTLRQGKPR